MSALSFTVTPILLRKVLWADALSGAATGALQLAVPGVLAAWLGLPVALLISSGLVIFAFVALAGYMATRADVSRTLLTLLVVGNWAWVVGCVALAFSGTLTPTAWGVGYLLVQAAVVTVLAELQWMGLRQVRAQPAW
jgi:hypothetical protein